MGRRRSAEAGDAEGDPPRERGEAGRAEQKRKRKRDEPSPRELVAAANAARDVAALVGTAAELGPMMGSSWFNGPSATRGYVVDQLPDRLRRWCFDRTKRNMEAMYERTWGWSNPEKRRELARGFAGLASHQTRRSPGMCDGGAHGSCVESRRTRGGWFGAATESRHA